MQLSPYASHRPSYGFAVAVVAIFMWVLTAPASASIVASTSGSNDPADSGWTLVHGYTVESDINAGGGTENGVDYWAFGNPEINKSARYQFASTSSLTDGAWNNSGGWAVTANLRVIETNHINGVMILVRDGATSFRLRMRETELYVEGPDADIAPTGFDATADYHTYQIIMTPGATAAQDSFAVLLDDVTLVTYARSVLPDTTSNAFWFGSGTSVKARAHWASVELAAIPEPASVGLLAAGSLMLSLRSRRHAKPSVAA